MPEVSQKKLDRLRHLAGRGLHHVGGGGKESAMILAGGAGAEVVLNMLRANLPDSIKNAWYGDGLVLAVGGHFIKRKKKEIGFAMLGAAGYALAKGYRADQAKKTSDGTAAKGYDDGAGDAGALMERMGAAVNSLASAGAQLNQMASGLASMGSYGDSGDAGAVMAGAGDAGDGDWGDAGDDSPF